MAVGPASQPEKLRARPGSVRARQSASAMAVRKRCFPFPWQPPAPLHSRPRPSRSASGKAHLLVRDLLVDAARVLLHHGVHVAREVQSRIRKSRLIDRSNVDEGGHPDGCQHVGSILRTTAAASPTAPTAPTASAGAFPAQSARAHGNVAVSCLFSSILPSHPIHDPPGFFCSFP